MKQLLIETVNNEQPLQIDESSLLEWTTKRNMKSYRKVNYQVVLLLVWESSV